MRFTWVHLTRFSDDCVEVTSIAPFACAVLRVACALMRTTMSGIRSPLVRISREVGAVSWPGALSSWGRPSSFSLLPGAPSFAAFFAALRCPGLVGEVLPSLREQLDGALVGDVVDRVAALQRLVVDAVGDVGAEAAVLQHDGLARHGVVAQLLERRLGRALPPTEGLRLGEEREPPRRA